MNYRISYQCCSHTGKLRKSNQDNFLCGGAFLPEDQGTAPAFVQGALTGKAVFGVFDGMGGEEKGELAALMAAQTAAQMQPRDAPLEDLMEVCRKANGEICRYIAEENLRAMGTTAAMVCLCGEEASLCSVGDSSIFRLRQGMLEQLNQLHTMPGAYGSKPGLYQYLGIPEREQLLEPDLRRERLSPGDIYLLCTDGLTDMLAQTEMEQLLNTQPFDTAAQRLQDAALERGGKDNITLIVYRVETAEEKGKTAMAKKEAPAANKPSRKNRRNLLLAAAAVLAAVIAAAAGYLNAPTQIRVARQPDKTEYIFAQRLEPQGLALEVTYRSGKTEIVTQDIVCRPLVLNESGTQQITAQWKDLTVQFPVEVVAQLEQIRLVTLPDNLWYVSSDSLDATGLTLEASYTDGSTVTVTEGFALENTVLAQPGQQTVTVNYENQTASFDVTVAEVTEITVKTPAARLNYMVGQSLVPGGITLTAHYSDGTQKTIDQGFTCEEVIFDREGQQDITVTYAGHEATFPVTVYPQVTFARLRAYGGGGSDSYGDGQNQNGRWITWRLYIEHTLQDGLWDIFRPGISCSWADVVNGDSWEESARFEYAKEGQTHVEYGVSAGRGARTYSYSLNLPDDPSIAGEQWVEIYVGNSAKRITFTLTYLGDYETGTGWRVSNVKF